jgi:hypothetical protein
MKYLEFVGMIAQGTELQRIESLKPFLGTSVELTGTVKGIDEVSISVLVPDDPTDYYRLGILIFQNTANAELRQQLLSYAFDDEVQILAQVSDWRGHMFYNPKEYKLDLISIRRLSTKEGREKDRVAKEEAAKALERERIAKMWASDEMKRRRRNAGSKENAGTGAGIGAAIGGIVMGSSGCASCLNHLPPPGHLTVPPFNLFTGLLFGAIGGAVIGAVLGITIGQMKD